MSLARPATRDVEVHGRVVPAGRKVLLLYASANRDPRVYGADAEELDVGRNPQKILTFSYGPHFCLGASAAKLEARVALEELLSRAPGFLADGEAGTYAPGSFVRRFQEQYE